MAKKIMRRKASDNIYLHKDFHGSLSIGIEYLDQHYGAEAVRQFLRQFASAFYAALTEDLRQRGLIALKEYFERIYQLEGGKIKIDFSKDELVITVKACPAVTHMRKNGYHVARLFYETTKTVNETICGETPFAAEMLQYDKQTGKSLIRFFRRAS